MIVELAVMTVAEANQPEFEAALQVARQQLASSPGFLGLEVLLGIETPDQYTLVIRWRELADHTEGFRESENFVQWRALLSPYFAAPPQVQHWQPRTELALPQA